MGQITEYVDYHTKESMGYINVDSGEYVYLEDVRESLVKVDKKIIIAHQRRRNKEDYVLIPGYVLSIDIRENKTVYKIKTIEEEDRELIGILVRLENFTGPLTFW